ncbi:hypothetical protein [Ferruginibacter sp. SUN106]|uniref:hypothetical protein n=1 Tax=Ferruginibacter sp. SUN106 TaxID=2978348 RepID=UPI003D3601CB
MTTTKKLGIWMDHSNAHLMEFENAAEGSKTIAPSLKYDVTENSMEHGEKTMHHKEQQQQASWYKQLGEVIKNYEDVVLFGPTDAKTELFNVLKKDHHFDKIKIEIKQADKMSENQQHAFVREYFSTN